MHRRSFLKMALAGGTLAATWQPASAASGLVSKFQPSEPGDNAPKGIARSLKGIVTDNETPAVVNSLSADWMEIEFGPWNWNMDYQYNCKWALHLFNQIPNAGDVQQAIQHPSYEGWWLTLNEPDIEKMSASAAVNLVQKQMDIVLSVDPNASVCLGGGSQLHAPFKPNPWLPKVWKKLPAYLKPSIRAFHTHYYPQVEFGDTGQIYSPKPIKAYLTAWRNWIKKNAGDQPRQLWVTEIGLAATDKVRADSRSVLYPVLVQTAMDGLAERWAWYSESKRDGYLTLYDSGNAERTPHGLVFAGLKPGIYPISA